MKVHARASNRDVARDVALRAASDVRTRLGDVVYGPYRVDVKTMLFDLQLWPWNGVFEIKEHLVALGFFLLLPYAALWSHPLDPALARPRRWLTTVLALVVWYALVAGHLLNNLKGVGW